MSSAAASSGARAAPSAGDIGEFSASAATLLHGISAPAPAPTKRTAEEAELAENPAEPAVPRPVAPSTATADGAAMEVEVHEDPKSSSMLALVRVDGTHFKGGTQIDRHAEVAEAARWSVQGSA